MATWSTARGKSIAYVDLTPENSRLGRPAG